MAAVQQPQNGATFCCTKVPFAARTMTAMAIDANSSGKAGTIVVILANGTMNDATTMTIVYL